MTQMATNNTESLKGSWDFVSGENFEAILKELGLNKILRTLAKNVKPRLIIDEKNGKWSFKSESTFRTMSYEFVPDVEFDNTAPDGQQIKITIRFENGKWIQIARYKSGKEMFIQRWVNDQDQLQVIMKMGNTEATQLFRRSK